MLVHAEMHLRPEKVRLAAETLVPEERLLSRCARRLVPAALHLRPEEQRMVAAELHLRPKEMRLLKH
jgi:hypothetical protein